MVSNDNAPSLTPRGALRFIASKLAPTEEEVIRGLLQDPPKVFIKTTSMMNVSATPKICHANPAT